MRKNIYLFLISASIAFALAPPASALASSSQQSYSPVLIQTALRENMERYYYTFKDRLIKNPEHTVSDVKVLYSTQHNQTVILVGSCLIDRKENIIAGTLSKDKFTREMHYGGGWIETSKIKKPLFYGLGGNSRGAYISGISVDKSITQVRVIPMDGDQPVTLLVHDKYFAGWVPTLNRPEMPRGLRFSVEGLNHEGTVVHTVPQQQKARQNNRLT